MPLTAIDVDMLVWDKSTLVTKFNMSYGLSNLLQILKDAYFLNCTLATPFHNFFKTYA